MNVFDSSAVLVFVQNERGADTVAGAIDEGGACSAANWSEIAQKVKAHGGNWSAVREFLRGTGIVVEPVTASDAEAAAELWTAGSGLSLADRLCLALGERLGATVWTADSHWAGRPNVRVVR